MTTKIVITYGIKLLSSIIHQHDVKKIIELEQLERENEETVILLIIAYILMKKLYLV